MSIARSNLGVWPWLAAALVLGAAGAARAQPVQCSLAPTPLVLGAVDPTRGGAVTSTARVDVTCSTLSAVPVSVQLRLRVLGTGPAGGLQPLGRPDAPLFRLHGDPAGNLPLGDGTNGVALTASGVVGRTTPFRHSFTLYGTVPAGQRQLRAGSYRHSLSLVLDW